MKKLLTIAFLLFAITKGKTQGLGEGIHFEQGLTWTEVLQKAKKEHKNIFVDCYATWCGPCKKMDAEVYSLKEVGDIYNTAFICVKLQMDRTQKDDEQTKKWYGIADYFQTSYLVNSFPAFLFFDENGNPLHKVSGSEDPVQFIRLAKDALNPQKQYYSILKNFEPNKLDTAEEKGLASSFLYSDKVLAGKIAVDYLNRIPKKQLKNNDNASFMIQFQDDPEILKIAINLIKRNGVKKYLYFMSALSKQTQIKQMAQNYLEHLKEKNFFTNGNIQLAVPLIDTSANKIFHWIQSNPVKVDTVMHTKGYAKSLINMIAYKEDVKPILIHAERSGEEPDWRAIDNSINKKYGEDCSEYLTVLGKLGWYTFKTDWKNYSRYVIKRAEMDGVEKDSGSSGMNNLNNVAYTIFLVSEDKKELELALSWAEKGIGLVSNPPDYVYDTEASLLYKLGRLNEALEVENKAVEVSSGPDREKFLKRVEKMKKGLPTWSLPDKYGRVPND